MPHRAQREDVGLAAAVRRLVARVRALAVAIIVVFASAPAVALVEAPPPPPPPAPPAPSPSVSSDARDDYWDPPVITPTGQPSRVSESPSTMFVITGEEVRHAGATTIPEILRRVPGMDVRILGATDGQIGPRGFAFEVGDRVLVMVDGRTAYVDFFGGTAYEMLPI